MAFTGIRWLISLTLCFIGFATYFTRNNINYAIVDMVVSRSNSSKVEVELCPSDSPHNNSISYAYLSGEGDGRLRFDWSPEVQGLVLGSFYWTYFVFQTPSGYIAGRFGAWIPMSVSLLASGLISMAIPVMTATYSSTCLILMRAGMGFFQAAIFPGLFTTACNWAPVQERSTILAINELGPNIGMIVMQFSSGYLIRAYSWSSLFYAPAILSLFSFVIVAFFVRSRPEDHPLITQQELSHIRNSKQVETSPLTRQESSDSGDTVANRPQMDEAIPWSQMLCNRAVGAFFLFKFARSFAAYLIISEIPTYLSTVLRQSLVSVGIITSIGTALTLLSLFLSARISEHLVQSRYLTRTNSRKLFSVMSGLLKAVFLMLIPTLRCNRTPAIAVFLIDSFLYGCQTGSDTPLPAEMTSKYHSVLFSIGNVFASIPGFLAPMLTGYVLSAVDDQWLAWSIVFYSIGGILIFANVVFLLFGSASRQDFDISDAERRSRSYNSASICQSESS